MKKHHMNKMDISFENFWLQEKEGWEGGETKTTWDEWNRQIVGILNASVWNNLKRRHTGWKGLPWKSRWSRRISTPIEIWEHRLGKVWNQHLTSKQLEYQNQDKNKGYIWLWRRLCCNISIRTENWTNEFRRYISLSRSHLGEQKGNKKEQGADRTNTR